MRFGQVTLERQILFWGLGLVGLLLIVYLLGSTITPFAAGIVLGARVPIILTSRADSLLTRLASCAVAVMLAAARSKSPSASIR